MRPLALTALCLAVAACSTTNANLPPIGSSQTEIESGRVRVSYRGTSAMGQAEVDDRALVAAADATIARGYEWFRITNRFVDIAPPTTPRFSFGVGTGSYGRSGGFGVGTSSGFGGEGAYITTLEIVLGRGARPPTPDAYDARSVSDTIRPRLPFR